MRCPLDLLPEITPSPSLQWIPNRLAERRGEAIHVVGLHEPASLAVGHDLAWPEAVHRHAIESYGWAALARRVADVFDAAVATRPS